MYGGGLHVTTTLDLGCSRRPRGRRRNATCPTPTYNPAAALVAIDPQTGQILAMVGGRNCNTTS